MNGYNYFDGDSELEAYLERYNDEFPERDVIRKQLEGAFGIVDKLNFDPDCRVWKKPDLFTLVVELCRAMANDKKIDVLALARNLKGFYAKLGDGQQIKDATAREYNNATIQGTNHRGNRLTRGKVIQSLIGTRSRPYATRRSGITSGSMGSIEGAG